MGYSEEMKKNRLVFYEAEINEINEILDEFIDRTQAKSVLVIDKEGHLVTRKGFTQTIDTTSISALVAGSFASTREVAKMLGEEEFSMIFHQGKKESIHVSLINDRCMSVIIFRTAGAIGSRWVLPAISAATTSAWVRRVWRMTASLARRRYFFAGVSALGVTTRTGLCLTTRATIIMGATLWVWASRGISA